MLALRTRNRDRLLSRAIPFGDAGGYDDVGSHNRSRKLSTPQARKVGETREHHSVRLASPSAPTDVQPSVELLIQLLLLGVEIDICCCSVWSAAECEEYCCARGCKWPIGALGSPVDEPAIDCPKQQRCPKLRAWSRGLARRGALNAWITPSTDRRSGPVRAANADANARLRCSW